MYVFYEIQFHRGYSVTLTKNAAAFLTRSFARREFECACAYWHGPPNLNECIVCVYVCLCNAKLGKSNFEIETMIVANVFGISNFWRFIAIQCAKYICMLCIWSTVVYVCRSIGRYGFAFPVLLLCTLTLCAVANMPRWKNGNDCFGALNV